MTPKEIIVEQAYEMFFRSGIKSITMDDISRETGVSKRTIYENFRDKDELVASCLHLMDERFNREYDKIEKDSDNTLIMVFRFMKFGIDVLNSINPQFTPDLKKYHFRVWKETLTVNEKKYNARTLKILKKGIMEGVFRETIDVEVVSILLNEQLRIISDETVFPTSRFPKIVVFENVMINFFRGIATQKGLDLIDKYLREESDKFVTVRP